MKKIISALVAAAVITSACILPGSAASNIDYPDNFQLTNFDNGIGDGANDQWGTLSGGDNGKYANGTNMFTEGTRSSGIYASNIDHVSLFHNFVWNEEGSLIKAEPLSNVGKEGLDIIGQGYKYVEFDVASMYDVNVGQFSFCLCGSTDAWHGYDANRTNVVFKAGTWYHVAIRITDFEFRPDIDSPNPDVPDPSSSYQYSKFGLSCAQRMRMEITGAIDPETNDIPEELYFNIDDLRIVRYDNPVKEDTMVYDRPEFVYDSDKTTLIGYNQKGQTVTIPDNVTAIADGVFAGKDIKKVKIGSNVAEIGANNFEDIDGIVIVGVPGSFAETYAQDNGLDFEELKNIVYGDVDDSGNVAVNDALLALQAAVGKLALTDGQSERADVDGQAGISVTDALLILQYSVGKITVFPVEE